jgi:hypothetical protein
LVLEGLENLDDVGRAPELLRNADAKVRVRAAYLLCVKGWTPKDRLDAAIFYTHLMATLQCARVPEPAQDAARLAAADLADFLNLGEQYPAPGDVQLQVLVQAATDDAADYLCRQALEAKSEFQLTRCFRALKAMENDRAAACAKRLLADKNAGASIRAIDPAAAAP